MVKLLVTVDGVQHLRSRIRLNCGAPSRSYQPVVAVLSFMRRLLIHIGRLVLVVDAIVAILECAVSGWTLGAAKDALDYGFVEPYAVTPWRLTGLALSSVVGFAIVGVLWGVAARLLRVLQPRSDRLADPAPSRQSRDYQASACSADPDPNKGLSASAS
jgi:hypothetical protein